ncbi:MAG TPA: cytochrome c maturation protein CcmE [Acidocella sp.]|jgi:cytochrome c-type biogenesis protein CcmE|uniref:cytochrome c maturation protein CcmE n=1 Tax=Acidocella sp. TaxID=50710 RepID=UPI002B7F93D2|nr:cytochrome c maturation protein CcmE [Acidocella sp.]HVE21085.1 cytochrome c maturation protein CcmE [Acidocella sp.]
MQARKKRRLYLVLTCGLCLCAATGLMLAAFSSTLTYFLSPRQVLAKDPAPGVDFRLGGIVQVGTVNTKIAAGSDAPTTSFRVTDGQASVPVTFTGVLPDLFREGQGVVAIGAMTANGTFAASDVLAKHGSDYMPKDVEQALKQAGKWNPIYGPPPAASSWNTMQVKSTSS